MDKLLNAEEVQNLFTKFAFPLVNTAITDHQKKVSLGIAKILWVTLVDKNDTEKQVYTILDKIFKDNREGNIGVGSLYFFKMKKTLSKKEIKLLHYFYSIDENRRLLEDWLD